MDYLTNRIDDDIVFSRQARAGPQLDTELRRCWVELASGLPHQKNQVGKFEGG